MKTKKITYWVFTSLISIAFLMSGIMYLTLNPMLVQNFGLIGLPVFLLPLLGTAKLIGALSIINPWFPKLREWAYAGFSILLVGAIWIHLATSTPFVAPLIFLIMVGVSYYFLPYRSWSAKASFQTV